MTTEIVVVIGIGTDTLRGCLVPWDLFEKGSLQKDTESTRVMNFIHLVPFVSWMKTSHITL